MLLINMYKICTVVNINRMYCTVVKLLYFKIVSTNPSPLYLVPPPPSPTPPPVMPEHGLGGRWLWRGGRGNGGKMGESVRRNSLAQHSGSGAHALLGLAGGGGDGTEATGGVPREMAL